MTICCLQSIYVTTTALTGIGQILLPPAETSLPQQINQQNVSHQASVTSITLGEGMERASEVGHILRRRRSAGKGPGYSSNAAIAPVMQVARVPASRERNPRATISGRRCGAIAPSPPIIIPRLPGLAKPHKA